MVEEVSDIDDKDIPELVRYDKIHGKPKFFTTITYQA
jgi:hypothetical protein